MLYKMFRIEGTYRLNSEYLRKPRQIFVTKSRVLALKVQEYFEKIAVSLTIGSLSPDQLMEKAASAGPEQTESGLVDLDDERHWRSDLPNKFSELQDSDFPLFITFDHVGSTFLSITYCRNVHFLVIQLCDLIEGDYDPPERVSYAKMKGGQSQGKSVSFNGFQRDYWPHFPQGLTKGLGHYLSVINHLS